MHELEVAGGVTFLHGGGGASIQPQLLVSFDQLSAASALQLRHPSYLPLRPLGHGATGVVFLALHLPSSRLFALKSFPTSHPLSLHRSHHEQRILSLLPPHPFLPALHSFFDHAHHRFLVLDYCSGGDLNSLRRSQLDQKFSPDAIRFYAAEIVLALEHLHHSGVVYRDLKPENILVSNTGHVMLTDFDLSVTLPPKTASKMQVPEKTEIAIPSILRACISQRSRNPVKVHKRQRSASRRVLPVATSIAIERSYSFVGTEEYVAPEIILGTGHEFAVDWWALGVLLYEMLYGKSPFKGSNAKQTFRNILIKEVEFYGPWNPLQDLIRKLLAKKASERLGSCYGADEVKVHSFFEGLQWDALQDMSRPPFIPDVSDTDVSIAAKNGFDLTEHLAKVEEARAEERARRISAKKHGNS